MTSTTLALSIFVILAQGVFFPSQNVRLPVVQPVENGYVSLYPVLTEYDPGTGADVLLIHNYSGGYKLLDVKPGDVFFYNGEGFEVTNTWRSEDRPEWNPYPAGYLVVQTCLSADGAGWYFIWARRL